MFQRNKILSLVFLVLFMPNPSIAGISEIVKIEAKSTVRNIQISWEKPALQETEGSLLIRKEGVCPKNYNDGEEVYRGNGGSYEDKKAENGKKYCYGVFIYDSSGRVSNLNFSGLIEKENGLIYLLRIIQNDYFIFGGVGILVILFWIDKKNFLMWGEERKRRVRL